MFCPVCGTQYEGNFCPNGCNSPKHICPKCKTEYAGSFCPKCGTDLAGKMPQKPPKKFPVWATVLICIGAVLVLFIIFGVIVSMGSSNSSDSSNSSTPSVSDSVNEEGSNPTSENQSSNSETANEPEEEVIKVTAEDLYAEYEANEVAAEQKYKGKLLEITGTVDSISRDVLDDLYITLESDESGFSIASVQCYINEKDEASVNKAASLSKGDTVTIRGYVGSAILNLTVEKCTIQ